MLLKWCTEMGRGGGGVSRKGLPELGYAKTAVGFTVEDSGW